MKQKSNPEYHRRHYLANKDSYIRAARAHDATHVARSRRFLTAYKEFFGCERCPVSDVRVLECHHIGKKNGNIGNVWRSWSLSRLVTELFKCEVLCANCHRIETNP